MSLWLQAVLSVSIGYLLGSLSPAYLFGRLLKSVDIRTVGFRNAGARNVMWEVGKVPAVLTAVIDLGKGAGAAALSLYAVGLPESYVFLPAGAAVLGHIFPFYLHFKGGKGHATAVGIYLFFMTREAIAGSFDPLSAGAILLVALIIFLASRKGDITGIVTFGFMTVVTPLTLGWTTLSATLTGVALFLLVTMAYLSVRRGLFRFPEGVELKAWRIIARPFALLFIPIDIIWGRTVALIILGVLSLIFSVTDLVRFGCRLSFARIFKQKEERSFSSMTKFLVSIFFTFLIFGGEIPYLGLTFITVGDLFAKVIGVLFGKRKLFKSRTVAGTLGFAGGCLAAGYILYLLLPGVPLVFVVAGSLLAALIELFSEAFDDNFTVGLISSAFLTGIRHFFNV